MKTLCFLLLAMSGCSVGKNAGAHADTQTANQEIPRTIPEPRPQTSAKEDERGYFAEVKSEVQQSNNATQNSITGLGVQVTKIAEKVDLAAVKAQAEINTAVRNEMRAQAELTAQLHANVRSDVKASAELVASMEARIDAKLQAQVQAQAAALAGIGNKVESLSQTYSSGRDTNTTQFSREMADTLISSQRQPMYMLLILGGVAGGVIIFIQEHSRRRAEARARKENP